jgi:hypothetical protein
MNWSHLSYQSPDTIRAGGGSEKQKERFSCSRFLSLAVSDSSGPIVIQHVYQNRPDWHIFNLDTPPKKDLKSATTLIKKGVKSAEEKRMAYGPKMTSRQVTEWIYYPALSRYY